MKNKENKLPLSRVKEWRKSSRLGLLVMKLNIVFTLVMLFRSVGDRKIEKDRHCAGIWIKGTFLQVLGSRF